jgi:hypothetical protein
VLGIRFMFVFFGAPKQIKAHSTPQHYTCKSSIQIERLVAGHRRHIVPPLLIICLLQPSNSDRNPQRTK